jgi:hypothetical protein
MNGMFRRRAVAILIVLATCFASCALQDTSHAPAPAESANASSFATTDEVAIPGTLRLALPSGWHTATYDFVATTPARPVLFFGPGELTSPCQGAMTCANRWPPAPLRPNSLVAGIWHWETPDLESFPGEQIQVGQSTWYWSTVEPTSDGCRAIGGDVELRVIDGFSPIPTPPTAYRWDEVDACISGPDATTTETTLRQILGIG